MIGSDGGLSTVCHSCGFSCQQRVLKTFPGPGYLHSEDGVVWLYHFLTFSHSKSFKFTCCLWGFHIRIALNLLKSALLSIPHACPEILNKIRHILWTKSVIKLKLFRRLCDKMTEIFAFFILLVLIACVWVQLTLNLTSGN